MSAELEEFLELRASLVSDRIGSGGREVCRALTGSLDRALTKVAARLGGRSSLAVIAVGGYGREELSLFSDVDLMLLHDGGDPSDAAAALFRPLWDAGLRLGHSVRTVEEAASAARERFDTFTTLLTSRLVAGDPALAGRLLAEVSAVTRARPLRGYLVAEERRRRADHPYLRMGTDVKTGRGGLRTLHGFEWERRREALIGRFSAPAGPEEETTRERLLAIRNALHAATGRGYDVYSYDLREPVSRWLGSDVPDVAAALVDTMVTVDRLASRRWPELGAGVPGLARARSWSGRGGDAATVSFEEFTSILRSGEGGRAELERLHASGALESVLPGWHLTRVTPQLAPFHEHPLEAHLWRTVDEMETLAEGDDDYAAIARDVASRDALTLAAFLHDIGKGHGGDHARVGAVIARDICERLLSPPEVSALVEGAVRHHLLLSETAMRQDLDDPAVIGEVAEKVGDLTLLRVLYLLTVADSKATGRTMWNEWKATLVRTLFVRCAARFGTRNPTMTGTTREQVVVKAPASLRARVRSHIDGMPDEYLRSSSAEDVLWHLELIEAMTGDCGVGVRTSDVGDTAVVVGRVGQKLRRCAAEAFAANGVDVLQARMSTRADGVIVDTFQARGDRSGRSVATNRWDATRSDIEAALAGETNMASKVASRASAYLPADRGHRPPSVEVSTRNPSNAGMIVVRCSDRIGRLAELLSILHEQDIDIRLAKLETREGELIDTFHVPRSRLPDDPADIERLTARIRESLSS